MYRASIRTFIPFAVALLLAPLTVSRAAELGGVNARFNSYQGPAIIEAQSLERFKIQVVVDPKTETRPLVIRVDLPNTGAHVWPAADVEVRDAQGNALLVRRNGIEWFSLLIPVPPVVETYFVQVVPVTGGQSPPPSDRDRVLIDTTNGLRLVLSKWYDGRAAALSIRFDDSHPTHLTKAVPILNEYGFKGTFMVNPAASERDSRRRSDFEAHQAEWEAVGRQGKHEFANHSAHHRGGFGDEDMEAEIGDAAHAIWKLTPGKSKLMALNLGGGTRWETTRTLRYYLDKYHQFDASENSTGMDDSYGNRVANFRRILEQHIQRGLWCRIHYHYIGDGLSSSESNFRAALDIAKEHAAGLWIAGMTDIYKYQAERTAAKVELLRSEPNRLKFRLICSTNVTLYDQPLTIEVTRELPLDAAQTTITNVRGEAIPVRVGQADDASVLRFDVPPINAVYSIEMRP